jgi:Mg2+-importing ATPase
MDLEQLFGAVESSPDGLSTADAEARLAKDGPNSLGSRESRGRLRILLNQLTSPIILILAGATVVSMALGDVIDGTIILAIIAASSVLGAWQEHSAGQAVEALLRRVQVRAEVMRDGAEQSIPLEEVVRGDIVVLSAGDIVPADCRLVQAQELLVDEATLTGESFPVEKAPGTATAEAAPGQRLNSVFRGTHVMSGIGRALVVRTGLKTEFGAVAEELSRKRAATGFEKGVTNFGLLLVRAMAVLVTAVFIINLVLDRPLIDSLLFSLALAVGLTPQMLPAIVAISLATGARAMAREQVIVKRLDAIEDFGSMSILCVDKTGTITAGSVRLDAAVDLNGKDSADVLKLAKLNSGLQKGFANPLDEAILGGTRRETLSGRLGEVPYDFRRKRLSVLAEVDGTPTLITKGAFDQVLGTASEAETDAGRVPIEKAKSDIQSRYERFSADGFRVLALATREMPGKQSCSADDEQGMVLRGLLVFHDPPKEGAADSIKQLLSLGVSLRIVTGDNRLAAKKVAGDVGVPAEVLLTGADVDALSDQELATRALGCHVFAEVEPLHKERIVRALRSNGAVVGFLGDGINDAAALHAADVGISVDTAVDVAKQAAAIVLLDKSLGVIAQGVALGRRTFANTLKYIRVTVSANFGNVLSMAAASAFLPFLPLLPRQILLLNFLSDMPALTLSNDTVDEELLRRPSRWDVRAIRNFMVVFGLVSSVFDLATFGLLRIVLDADAPLFRSAWFVESTLTELAVLLVLRTHRPFYRSAPAATLLWTSAIIAGITLALPFSPLNDALGMVHLPLDVSLALIGLTLVYVVVNELVKRRAMPVEAEPAKALATP